MGKWTTEKVNEVYALAAEKAKVDEAFRKALVEHPNKAIEELSGMEVPADFKIRVIEYDPAYQATFVLPEMLGDEFSADDLDAVAGGACGGDVCAGNVCGGNISK